MTALSNRFGSVNLGQGFPTFPVPEFLQLAASTAINTSGLLHQYSRSQGHPRLVSALSTFYSSKLARKVDPEHEVLTTVGATEALYNTIQAFVNPSDEVIIFEPFFDSYPASIILSGGTSIPIPLTPKPHCKNSKDWCFDVNELRRKVSEKTKLIVLNNPHNPTGKVWSREELMSVALIAQEFDLIVVADEVYETLIYKDEMIKFASLPGMFERTITVGSCGKMFGVTGWKVGWCIGPRDLIKAVWMVHQFSSFCVATALQEAVASAFEYAATSDYFEKNTETYKHHRDVLVDMLVKHGFDVVVPQGGYFVMADTSKMDAYIADFEVSDPRRDFRVCRYMTEKVGVTAIPPSPFYLAGANEITQKYARFAFCKQMQMINDADTRMTKFFNK